MSKEVNQSGEIDKTFGASGRFSSSSARLWDEPVKIASRLGKGEACSLETVQASADSLFHAAGSKKQARMLHLHVANEGACLNMLGRNH